MDSKLIPLFRQSGKTGSCRIEGNTKHRAGRVNKLNYDSALRVPTNQYIDSMRKVVAYDEPEM